MNIRLRPLFVPAVLVACGALLLSLARQAPSETALRVMEYAEEKEVPFSSYPGSVIELLERNPEAEDFVLNYPFREEKKVDLSGYDLDGGVPLFLQWDRQWGYLSWGSGCVGVDGSAPMCLAMAGYHVSGGDEKFSPDRVVEFIRKNGYYADGSNAGWTIISRGGTALGLKVRELPLVEGKMTAYLKNGDPVSARMGPGEFDNYVVLTGYREGFVTVNDPDSRINSEKQWNLEEISGQIRTIWVVQMGT